ncbi:MAG: anti-sigma factor [Pleurocapsa minor GSE-CHR-MK-17-07R]|jgi:anti-sigma-K factor RskA|nr:anti-sigma factor [Pleurocapsa minor GSE-CHR-MK 17-07R]
MTTGNQTQYTSECDELSALLPAYALGASSPEEAARVRELMTRCPDAEQELAQYAHLTGMLAETVTPVAPPPSLRASLLAKVAAESAPSEVSAPPAPAPAEKVIPFPAPKRAFPWRIVAAAAVAIVVLSNVYWAASLNAAQERLASLEQQQGDVVTLLSAEGVQRLVLSSAAGEQALAVVLWSPEQETATLVTNQLPPLSDDLTYQLWLIGDAGPVSAGLFRTNDAQQVAYAFNTLDGLTNYAAVGISVEPASGSSAPTTDPLAVGAVDALDV